MNAEISTANQEEIEALSRHLMEEKEKCIAQEKEIWNLKQKVKIQDKAEILAVADNTALRQESEELQEKILNLKSAVKTFLMRLWCQSMAPGSWLAGN